jgi:abortive infection bacteriophage resistance protein
VTLTRLEKVIGRRRYREFKSGLLPSQRIFTVDLFRFDVELRGLVIKSLSIIEIALQNQIIAVSKPQKFESFGHARRILQELPTHKQFAIAQKFGCANGKELRAILRVLNDARNRAAHHERIWNCKLNFCLPSAFLVRRRMSVNYKTRSFTIAGAFDAIMDLLSNFPEILQIEEELDNLLAELPIDRKYIINAMGFEVP